VSVPVNQPLANPPRPSLAAVFTRFLRFGASAWGGPVAQIAMLQRELVDGQRWVTRERFRRAFAVYQALPGPEAHEMCVWFGTIARGRLGGLLAGLGFLLPGLVLMLGVAWLYSAGVVGEAALRPVLGGMQAAVVAVIVRALFRLGGHAMHDRWLLAIGAGAFVATLSGVPFGLLLLAGGVGRMAVARHRWFAAACVLAAAVAIAWWWSATPAAGALVPSGAPRVPSADELFAAGLRGGLLTFGGAYTAIPFVQHDAVVVGGWLTPDQFLDGVALASVMPAPLVIFATFVGFVAGDLVGALAMTAGMFVPAFLFPILGHDLFERWTANPTLHAFLDGVTAAVVGVMAGATVGLARASAAAPATAGIAVAGLLLVCGWRARGAVPAVVLGGGACGWFWL
jgi:chromate transporter